MKKLYCGLLFFVTLAFLSPPESSAQGLFGRPEGYSKGGRGLYTAIGFIHQRNVWENDQRYLNTEKMVFSELGYGLGHGIEVYGRLGFVDGLISGPIGPPSLIVSSTDMRADDRFIGTAGGRWSYALYKYLRLGLFAQGSYYINDGSDEVLGVRPDGRRTFQEVEIERQWVINGGVGFQADLPTGMKLYFGPYLSYGEGKMKSLPATVQLRERIKTKQTVGAYGGFSVPLIKRFSLTCEGWYGARFSLGTMISYTY